MGNCCGSKVQKPGLNPVRTRTRTAACQLAEDSGTCECPQTLGALRLNLEGVFKGLVGGTYTITVNGQEVREDSQYEKLLREADSIQIVIEQDREAQFDDYHPLIQIAGNVFMIKRDNLVCATGIFLSDSFVLTSSAWIFTPNDLVQDTALKFSYSQREIEINTLFSFPIELGDLILIKTVLPLSVQHALATTPMAKAAPTTSDTVQVLFFSTTKPLLQCESAVIRSTEGAFWELSTTYPAGSLGSPVLDSTGNLVGILTGSSRAVCLEPLKATLAALEPTEENLPLQVLIARWGLDQAKHSSGLLSIPDAQRGDSAFSNISSLGAEGAVNFIQQVNREPQEKMPRPMLGDSEMDELTSETEDINALIAESLGLEYSVGNIYTERGYCVSLSSSKLLAYHPLDFTVSQYELPTVPCGYSLTPCELGVFIVFENVCLFWELGEVKEIAHPDGCYLNHATLIHEGQLVLIGGKDTECVETMNLQNFSWSDLPDLPCLIEQAAAVSHEKSIYLLGGVEKKRARGAILKLTERWEQIAVALPMPLAGFGTIPAGDAMYLVGGYSNRSYNKKYWKFCLTGDYEYLGEFPLEGAFFGLQFGCGFSECTGFTRNGRIIKFERPSEKLFLVSIGNYDHSAVSTENYLHSSFFS